MAKEKTMKTGQKRKEHPYNQRDEVTKRARTDHRAKQREARAIPFQKSAMALRLGELNVDKFVQAREHEIRALEEGMSRSKKALNTRAFQQVPKELRRRTASHNVKRVPKRLQSRAKREMVEDNTATVTPRKRKLTRHMRLRIEVSKRLRSLGGTSKAAKHDTAEKVRVRPMVPSNQQNDQNDAVIKLRKPRVKKISLAVPPVPKAKFRKRQINKTWLPTHMFHAKRARMTPPTEPLWKYAIPLTPTAKSYRPTHRAANERGAVAWDVSYVCTMKLEGQQRSIDGVLKALGVGLHDGNGMWQHRGDKWRKGTRIWEGLLYEREATQQPIAPAIVIWCALTQMRSVRQDDDPHKRKRAVFLRVHPSAFSQVWVEVVRLSKVIKPQVGVQDLRYEIGSIEIAGPDALEALQGILWPSPALDGSDFPVDSIEYSWKVLSGMGSQAALPPNALLGFDVQDPRLHHPPRTSASPVLGMDGKDRLVKFLADWPIDSLQGAPGLFERQHRLAASSALPSQKSINRRKALTNPGQYPDCSAKDPRIPVLICCRRERETRETVWTVLLPWKCVLPVWYSIMYYPLSTGGQPRFGGLDELRQCAFERGNPWFPGDYPGTHAGWIWEVQERNRLYSEWSRRPKSKRVNWDAVKLDDVREGELGPGWACDWQRLFNATSKDIISSAAKVLVAHKQEGHDEHVESRISDEAKQKLTEPLPRLIQISTFEAQAILNRASVSTVARGTITTVDVQLLNRGVPLACARIYRLPSSGVMRKRWLQLHPRANEAKRSKGARHGLPLLPKDAPSHVTRQRLAMSLLEPLQPGRNEYPPCPEEEDLIGFITSGNYNLAQGQGSGVGNIAVEKVAESVRSDAQNGHLCIVRNAGNGVGRLAKWTLA